MSLVSFSSYTQQQKILQYYHDNDMKAREDQQDTSMESAQRVTQMRLGSRLMANQCWFDSPPSTETFSHVTVYHADHPRVPVLSTEHTLESKDDTANEVFKGLQSADSFYRTFCGIAPVLTKHGKMDAFIHDPKLFNNACWNGLDFQFGDSDPAIFSTFSNQDIITHEVGHAVTTFSANFAYQGESGALNESMSDVFAIIQKQLGAKVNAGGEDADWDIAKIVNMGNGVYAPLRSLSNPGRAFTGHSVLKDDDQVSHMDQFEKVDKPTPNNDFGYVHKHSGIPNSAFYRSAVTMQGSVEKIGKLWWQALKDSEENDDFAVFASKTIEASKKLGFSREYENALRQAWKKVGIVPFEPKMICGMRIPPVSNWPVAPSMIGTIALSAMAGAVLVYGVK